MSEIVAALHVAVSKWRWVVARRQAELLAVECADRYPMLPWGLFQEVAWRCNTHLVTDEHLPNLPLDLAGHFGHTARVGLLWMEQVCV